MTEYVKADLTASSAIAKETSPDVPANKVRPSFNTETYIILVFDLQYMYVRQTQNQ